jgi:hypothetical protein
LLVASLHYADSVEKASQNPHAAMLKMLAARKPPSPPKEEPSKNTTTTTTTLAGSTPDSSSITFGAVGDNVNIAKVGIGEEVNSMTIVNSNATLPARLTSLAALNSLSSQLEAGNGKGFHLFWVLPDGTSPSNASPSVALVLSSTCVILISTSGQTGTISWSMSRENVKSLTISNSGPTATLLFNDDSSKSFTFKTMENCFGFVQEHYKTKMEKGKTINKGSKGED